MGFPGGVVVKYPPDNAGDKGSIPRSGRFPEVGNGNPLQYSCLENSMGRGAWWATVHGVSGVRRDSAPSPSVYVFVKSECLSVCVYVWQLLVIRELTVLWNDPLCFLIMLVIPLRG